MKRWACCASCLLTDRRSFGLKLKVDPPIEEDGAASCHFVLVTL
jgi:hypothetical protein